MQQHSQKLISHYHLSRSILQKKYFREHNVLYSNGISLESMMNKRGSLRYDKLDQLSKIKFNSKNILLKKQIQPHQVKSAHSIMEKTKPNLFQTRMPELKQSKHKKNISAIWKCKKRQKEQKNQQFNLFRFNKPDKSNQIVMEAKKVQKSDKEDCTSNNGGVEETKDLEKEIIEEESKQVRKESIPKTRYLGFKQKIVKTNNYYPGKIKKSKEQIEREKQEKKKLFHLKNIINDPTQCDEETIRLVNHTNSALTTNSIQNVQLGLTANCFCTCYWNKKQNFINCVFEKNINKRVQIASLTKIMTCYVVLHIVKMFKLDLKTQKTLVSEKASKMPGTSAELTYSDILTIYQLLHGLMLPSGNDAAVALAEWGGKTIRKYCLLAQKQQKLKPNTTKSLNFCAQYSVQKKSYQKLFITHMNKIAKALNLSNTRFANTHGLMNENSYSTAGDIALLTSEAMKNTTFREIVSKREFTCKILNRTYSQHRKSTWKNTNKLLSIEGFLGVKTGVTPTAGPCLASVFEINENQWMIMVVLRVKSLEFRFKQSVQLLKEGVKMLQRKSYGRILDSIDRNKQQSYNDQAQNINTMQEDTSSQPDDEEQLY